MTIRLTGNVKVKLHIIKHPCNRSINQLNINPYAFPVVLFFTSSFTLNGPKKSRAVESHAGAGCNLSIGSLPIICLPSFFSIFLQIMQLFLMHLTSLSSLIIQNLHRILLAVDSTPRCPL